MKLEMIKTVELDCYLLKMIMSIFEKDRYFKNGGLQCTIDRTFELYFSVNS